MALVELIPLTRCRRGGGTFVARAGHELAVFWLADPERVVVLDNTCPHAGGNLSGGEVSDRTVTCRWHQWEFDLSTGVSTHSDRARVRRYDCEVRDGVVWVNLPD